MVLAYYGSFFVIGYLLHNHRAILETFKTHVWWYVALSSLFFPLAVWATSAEFAVLVMSDAPLLATVSNEVHGPAVLVNAILTWLLIYAFMGLFLRLLDYDSPWIRYMSNASYWVYLLHMPVITAGAWLLLHVPMAAEVARQMISHSIDRA